LQRIIGRYAFIESDRGGICHGTYDVDGKRERNVFPSPFFNGRVPVWESNETCIFQTHIIIGFLTFAKIMPAANLPKLLEIGLLADEEFGTTLFPYSMRICGSDHPAKLETLSAFVFFNLALTRHAQAIRSLKTIESSS
jgi:hypothetical protein